MRLQSPAQKTAGFTLIEMAFVIVIASTLLLMGVKAATAFATSMATKATTQRLENVREALQSHLNRFGRLPCPDLGVAPDIVNFDGLESPSCVLGAGNNWGVLPYVTLEIARADAQDAWGNMFLYQVSENWARAGAAIIAAPAIDAPIGSVAPPIGNITVLEKRADGTQVAAVPGVIAVVLSPGLNGVAAFGDKAVSRAAARTAPAGTDELDNTRLGADPNATRFISRPATDSTAAATGAFDDLVLYLTGPAMAAKATESVAFKGEAAKMELCHREVKAVVCASVPASCSAVVFGAALTTNIGLAGTNPRLTIQPGAASAYRFSLTETGCP